LPGNPEPHPVFHQGSSKNKNETRNFNPGPLFLPELDKMIDNPTMKREYLGYI
jgi:hypothetical protein